ADRTTAPRDTLVGSVRRRSWRDTSGAFCLPTPRPFIWRTLDSTAPEKRPGYDKQGLDDRQNSSPAPSPVHTRRPQEGAVPEVEFRRALALRSEIRRAGGVNWTWRGPARDWLQVRHLFEGIAARLWASDSASVLTVEEHAVPRYPRDSEDVSILDLTVSVENVNFVHNGIGKYPRNAGPRRVDSSLCLG